MAEMSSERIEHLKLIQAVVTRMASESGAVKRYCITIVGAALALSASAKIPVIAALAVPLIVVFWCLDAMYLRQERWFRKLYDDSVAGNSEIMQLTPSAQIRNSLTIGGVLFGWSVFGLYGPLALFVGIVWSYLAGC